MGLIDRLFEALIRTAAGGYSTRAQQRREFREQLLADLRVYSQLVEEVRVHLHLVAETLGVRELAAPSTFPEPLLRALQTEYDKLKSPESARMTKDRLRRPPLRPDEPPRDELDLIDVATRSLYEQRWPVEPVDAPENALTARLDRAVVKFAQLNEAWASIRPRLDEAIDLEAVAYLRAFRHDFRYLVHHAVHMVEVSAREPTPQALKQARELVDLALEAADHWNAHVVGTISHVRDDRPM